MTGLPNPQNLNQKDKLKIMIDALLEFIRYLNYNRINSFSLHNNMAHTAHKTEEEKKEFFDPEDVLD